MKTSILVADISAYPIIGIPQQKYPSFVLQSSADPQGELQLIEYVRHR